MLKPLNYLFFYICKVFFKYKRISKINFMDFNTYPSEKIVLSKHLENGILRNSYINKEIIELKIRGNKKLIYALNSFQWLFLLSSINSYKSKKYTEYLFKKSNILELNFNYLAWRPDITGLRLLALSLNINFIILTRIFEKNNKLALLLGLHVLYLKLSKLFIYRSIKSLRINMGIFFCSFLLTEFSLKRNTILKEIIKDLDCIFDKKNKIKTRNPSDILEILFFINRILKFSSTADFSNGKIDKILKKFQNKICPILKGLRLGNGLLVRSNNCSGFSIYCELEKELFDASPSDISIKKNPIGFIRFNPGRLTFLLNSEISEKKKNSSDFMCSAFSFELTSGENILFQNNSSFFCNIGKSDEIIPLKNQMNTLGLKIQEENRKSVDFESKLIDIKQHRDLKYNYLDVNKVISYDETIISYNRNFFIPFAGNLISCKEKIILNETSNKNNFFFIPFYLHPDVEAWKSDSSNNFLLKLKNNEIWRFDTDQKNLLFEEYQFLDPLDLVMKKGYRIVLTNYFNIKETFFNWKLYLQSFSKRISK